MKAWIIRASMLRFLTDVTPFSNDVDHEDFVLFLLLYYRYFCVFSFHACNSIIKLSLKEKSVRIVAVDLVFRPIRWLWTTISKLLAQRLRGVSWIWSMMLLPSGTTWYVLAGTYRRRISLMLLLVYCKCFVISPPCISTCSSTNLAFELKPKARSIQWSKNQCEDNERAGIAGLPEMVSFLREDLKDCKTWKTARLFAQIRRMHSAMSPF